MDIPVHTGQLETETEDAEDVFICVLHPRLASTLSDHSLAYHSVFQSLAHAPRFVALTFCRKETG